MTTFSQFPEPVSKATVLNSWKEIAVYLGRGVRTVQRWEATLGLPVHRTAVGDRSPVLAFPHEVDRWLADRPLTSREKSDEQKDDTAPIAGPAEPRSDRLGDALSVHLDRLQKLVIAAEQLNATVQRAKRTHGV